MQEQQERPVTTAQAAPSQSEPRQPWQRPTLQRLHVSLDTAKKTGSNTDGFGASAPP